MGIHEEEAARLAKLQSIKESGINPYPARVKRTHTIAGSLGEWEKLSVAETAVILVGRLRAKRGHGGLLFATLEDGTEKIQIAFKKDILGVDSFKFFNDHFDIGDFIEVEGTLFKTKLGESTLLVNRYSIIVKSLLPLPEKWHGLSDVEARYRKRYLDLIANPETRELGRKRSVLVRAIRDFFDNRGYIEVETPILQTVPGGAAARPFSTHHNALDIELFLRVAPELYLKRLLVGGYEKVYEIARCFRNEGIDHTHNPEFTQVEAYEAYADFNSYMEMVEELLPFLVKRLGLDVKAVSYEDQTINFEAPYPRLTYREALIKYAKLDIKKTPDLDSLSKAAKKLNVEIEPGWSYGEVVDAISKKYVRPAIKNPTFITHHPIELSPLAKKSPEDPAFVERFQLYAAGGFELMNAFSELNDPLDQEARFKDQESARAAGAVDIQRGDADFVTALKHGMPPAAGIGIGIDRLTMLLCNVHSIKEVILFPTLRPE